MDKKEILQFEIDDASEMSANGKQVFFTKRINGKTTHNKLESQDNISFLNNNQNKKEEFDDDDDLFIDLKKMQQRSAENKRKNHTTNKKNIKGNKNSNLNKKNRKKSRVLKIMALFLVIIGITIFAMISPIFNIEELDVTGNEKIDSSTIISLAGIKEGENIFRISKNNIINKIKENPYIDSVVIKRSLPGTLKINVKERVVAYQIKAINSYVYIDYQGYILETSSKDSGVPILEGLSTTQDTLLNGKRISNEDIEKIGKILRIMSTAKSIGISDKITKISVQNNEYSIELKKEKKMVYIGSAKDLTNKFAYLKAILTSEKDKAGKVFVNVDFSKGYKPYFREEEI